MNPLRVGILGCGMMSGAHARRWKARSDVAIVALCDTEAARIDSLVQRRLSEYQPAPTRYTDPVTMFREAHLDAVAIVTPHALHYAHASAALAAGCHVLLEKPMVIDPADGDRLAAQAREAGRTVLTCYNTPYTRAFRRLRSLLRERELGRLTLVSAYLAQNWRTLTRGSWRQDPRLSGGGQAYDSGAHLLAGLCWVVGSPVREVYCRLDRRDTQVDIDSALTLTFDDGTLAAVAIGGDSLPDGSFGAFICERGRIELDPWRGESLKVIGEKGELPSGIEALPEISPNDHLIEVIRGQAQPLVSIADGVSQSRLMNAIYASAERGLPVRLG